MCMAASPLALSPAISPLAAILPKNPVTSMAEHTINKITAPVTKPVTKATGLKIDAGKAYTSGTPVAGVGLQIPGGS